MKMRRAAAAALGLLLLATVGCATESPLTSKDTKSKPTESVQSEEVEPEIVLNPLTGCSGFDKAKTTTRPVAIMINNINVAQKVQTGVNMADIIYETEVEGGITRLMAVYQNIEAVDQIGTVRSCRYPYIDLALGHNAIYVHCGQDNTYAKPHLKDIDDLDLSEGNYGKRIKNGLATEHTLYTFGKTLWAGLTSKFSAENKNSGGTWVTFAEEDKPVQLTGGVAGNVTVPFSTSYKTGFSYDASTGLYTRLFNGTVNKDYKSGAATTVKNVFILLTKISNYPDGKHRKVELTSGEGFYVTNGNYTPIHWSKGNSTSSFKFTNPDGSELTVNPGKSWVCLANATTSAPKFS